MKNANVTPNQGEQYHHTIESVAQDNGMGYGHFQFKLDQEQAILSCKEAFT